MCVRRAAALGNVSEFIWQFFVKLKFLDIFVDDLLLRPVHNKYMDTLCISVRICFKDSLTVLDQMSLRMCLFCLPLSKRLIRQANKKCDQEISFETHADCRF